MGEVGCLIHFDPQKPCVVCGKPTNCGVAYIAELQGVITESPGEPQGTWVMYPYCEHNTDCQRHMAQWVRKIGGDATCHIK